MTDDKTQTVSRGEARRRAMMDAAWETVLEKGFSACTLDDIISVSGGSKSTVYNQFGDKDGLFATVLQERCDAFCEELEPTFESNALPHQMLYAYADLLAQKVTSEESIRFLRLILTEGQSFPPLTQSFITRGPARVDQGLTDYLAAAHEQGHLNIQDPQLAAGLLLDMILGRWTESLRVTLMSDEELSAHAAQLRIKAKAAVDLFLAATTPKPD